MKQLGEKHLFFLVLYTVFKFTVNKYGFLPCNFLWLLFPTVHLRCQSCLNKNFREDVGQDSLCNAFFKKQNRTEPKPKKPPWLAFLRDILAWICFLHKRKSQPCFIIYDLGIQPKHMYMLKSVLHLFNFVHMSSLIGFSLMKWHMRDQVSEQQGFQSVGFFRAATSMLYVVPSTWNGFLIISKPSACYISVVMGETKNYRRTSLAA